MQIPAFKKPTADTVDLLADGASGPSASASKALPPMAVLSISTSAFLRIFYRLFYGLFVLSLFIALFPYISDVNTGGVVRLVWLALLLGGCIGLWHLYALQCAAIPVGSLAYENGFLVLSNNQKEQLNCVLVGEVLCWPWLIVLPLQSEDGSKRFLLLCHDAIKPADQARLRTWLRACLRPKG